MKRHAAFGVAAGLAAWGAGQMILLMVLPPQFLNSPVPDRLEAQMILPAALAIGLAVAALSYALNARDRT